MLSGSLTHEGMMESLREQVTSAPANLGVAVMRWEYIHIYDTNGGALLPDYSR